MLQHRPHVTMEVMKKVLVVGSATMDILVRSRDFRVLKSHQVAGGVALAEVYGGKTEAEEIKLETGGSGTNVAVGLARLGLVPASLARVGDDWMEKLIRDNLKLEGVETSLVQRGEGETTGMSVILVAPDGGRSIITYRGASKGLTATEVIWDMVAGSDWVQIGAVGGNLTLVEDLVSFARARKIGVGWNPGKIELGEKERVIKLLPKIDLLLLNRMEAAQFLHQPYEGMAEMARRIMGYGVGRTAITDGKRGAGIAERRIWLSAEAFKTKSVDDTGAGDAFTAGVVAGILGGEELEVALKMGLANGASEVTKLGAKSGLLTKKEMIKWLRKRLKFVEERI